MKAFMRRMYAKLLSPVPQDPDAVIYRRHGDAYVLLRPVVDLDGVITEWVPDPTEVALLNAAPAASLAPPVLPPVPPTVPAPPPVPPTVPAPPPVPPPVLPPTVPAPPPVPPPNVPGGPPAVDLAAAGL